MAKESQGLILNDKPEVCDSWWELVWGQLCGGGGGDII